MPYLFEVCLLRNPSFRNGKITIEKYKVGCRREGPSKNGSKKEGEEDLEEGWVKVEDRKGKKPMVDTYKAKPKTRYTSRPGRGIKKLGHGKRKK